MLHNQRVMFLLYWTVIAVFGLSCAQHISKDQFSQAATLNDGFFVHPNARGGAIDGRLIGGSEAPAHAFPYQVGLYCTSATRTTFCGGSLVSKNYILTAAHCVEKALTVEIILGAQQILETEETQQLRTSSEFIVHEDWDEEALINDIAFVKLSEPVEENDYSMLPQPVVFLHSFSLNVNDLAGNITGWGRIFANQEGVTPILRFLESDILSNDACKSVLPSYEAVIRSTHLCISGRSSDNVNVGTCNGDSGGPLVVDGVQVGLVSFGYKDCEEGMPSVFTRLTEFTDWIRANSDVDI
ncbi:hypothetical protein NQ318_005783 [Aromia moschata]|uniref:Peptidase S1 domain-containing protein n=1 Tax=Aromia moschata TaxID=1265417 RepID=A0AAV8YQI8_9CUCU|nr:hypothetical protein NQ318_005783 [Aromia moschata]